jgi:hypothetical protein
MRPNLQKAAVAGQVQPGRRASGAAGDASGVSTPKN